MEYKRVWAEINLDHLTWNQRAVQAHMPPGTKLMAVVKADAYGHGAVETSRTMLNNGADMLGVAICEEGVQLRQHRIHTPVLVLGFTPEPLFDEIIEHNLIQTVFSAETARALAKAAVKRGVCSEVHIKIDTGMGRLGFLPNAATVETLCEIAALPGLKVTGIYTHLATSDALDARFVSEQHARFAWLLTALKERGLRIGLRGIGNSGAFAQGLRRGAGRPGVDCAMDMMRLGILLYGLLPSGEMAEVCKPLSLKPVMRLLTQVSLVKQLPAGVGIGYGQTFRTARETRIATLPVGYADGYPRLLSNRARVLIGGRYAPIVGSICMDQCMVDVTDLPMVSPGDEVVMLGAQGTGCITADELAAHIGTIGYEVVCGVGKRVPRVFIKDNTAYKTLRMIY